MMMIEVCAYCGRQRPGYIADPTCPKEGGPLYCKWTTKLPAIYRNGGRIVAARPVSPVKHLAIAKLALERNDKNILDSALDDDFTFAGFVTQPGTWLVDGEGNIIDMLKPGDSLIDERAVTVVKK